MLVVIKDFTILDDGRATFEGRLQDAEMIKHLQPDVIFSCIPCSAVGQGKIFVAEYPQDSSLIVGILLWLAIRSQGEISEFAQHVQGDEAHKVAESLSRTLTDKAVLVESGEAYHLWEFCQEVKKMGNKKLADKAYRHAIDLYFSALLATGELQISSDYQPKYIELRFDCFSNTLQAFISSESWTEADKVLQLHLTSARHLNIWSGLMPKRVGKWAYRCALIKQANGERELAFQFAATAFSLNPHSKVRELLDQLQAGRMRTEVEQRLQKLVDLFCEIEEIDKYILRVVQQRCPDSIAVFRAGVVRMHDAMSGMQRHILLAHRESGSAFPSLSLIQEHPPLVPYETSILQEQTSQTFSRLQRKLETARGGSEEWSLVDQQEQKKAQELVKRLLFLNYVMRITGSDNMESEQSANVLQQATALKGALKSLQHHFIKCMPVPEAIRTELETKPITTLPTDDNTYGLHLIERSMFGLRAFTENV